MNYKKNNFFDFFKSLNNIDKVFVIIALIGMLSFIPVTIIINNKPLSLSILFLIYISLVFLCYKISKYK